MFTTGRGDYNATFSFIPFNYGGSEIKVRKTFFSEAGIAFYSDSTEASYISGVRGDSLTSANGEYNKINVPIGTKFARFCVNNSFLSSFEIRFSEDKPLIDELKSFDYKAIKRDVYKGIAGFYYDTNGSLISNADSFYREVVIQENVFLLIENTFNGTGRTILVLDSANNILQKIAGSANLTYTNFIFSGIGAAKLRISSNFSDKITVTQVNQDLKPTAVLSVKAPNYLYGIDNDSVPGFGDVYVSEQITRLFKEGLIKNVDDVKIFNFDSYALPINVKNTTTKQTYVLPIKLTSSRHADLSLNVNFIKTKSSNCLGKTVLYQAIGDSITDNEYPDIDGTGTYSYTHIMQKQAEKINKDHNSTFKVLSYGIRNFFQNSFVYKGSTILTEGNNEGRNGWTTASYLRHVAMAKVGTGTSGFGFYFNKAAWDSLGLGKKIIWNATSFANGYDFYTGITYENYTGSDVQRALIRTTVHGRYLPDLTVDLYNSMNDFIMDASVKLTRGLAYNVSENQKLMDSMVFFTENPLNPFYHFNTAQATTSYAFNYSVYIDRYRTRDTSGTKLLIGDSTIGSKINSGNIASINVGVPTHISICLSENDKQSYESTYSASIGYSEIQIMISRIKALAPTAKFCMFKTRKVGLLNEREDFVRFPFNNSLNTFNYDFNFQAISSLTTSAPENSNVAYLPIYLTMPPITKNSRFDFDPFFNKNTIVCSNDDTHQGQLANYDIGYSILSWILYTI